MKKNILFALILGVGVFLTFGVAAQDVSAAVEAFTDCSTPGAPEKEIGTDRALVCSGGSWLYELPQGPQTAGKVLEIIEGIAQWVFAIFLAVSVIFLVVGAFQFVTGRGDPAQVNKARETLLYSVIGIGLAFMANAVDDILRFLLT